MVGPLLSGSTTIDKIDIALIYYSKIFFLALYSQKSGVTDAQLTVTSFQPRQIELNPMWGRKGPHLKTVWKSWIKQGPDCSFHRMTSCRLLCTWGPLHVHRVLRHPPRSKKALSVVHLHHHHITVAVTPARQLKCSLHWTSTRGYMKKHRMKSPWGFSTNELHIALPRRTGMHSL
jgi:hypothetical protein